MISIPISIGLLIYAYIYIACMYDNIVVKTLWIYMLIHILHINILACFRNAAFFRASNSLFRQL